MKNTLISILLFVTLSISAQNADVGISLALKDSLFPLEPWKFEIVIMNISSEPVQTYPLLHDKSMLQYGDLSLEIQSAKDSVWHRSEFPKSWHFEWTSYGSTPFVTLAKNESLSSGMLIIPSPLQENNNISEGDQFHIRVSFIVRAPTTNVIFSKPICANVRKYDRRDTPAYKYILEQHLSQAIYQPSFEHLFGVNYYFKDQYLYIVNNFRDSQFYPWACLCLSKFYYYEAKKIGSDNIDKSLAALRLSKQYAQKAIADNIADVIGIAESELLNQYFDLLISTIYRKAGIDLRIPDEIINEFQSN